MTMMHQWAASVCALMFAWVWGSYHFQSCHRPSEFTRSGAASVHCAARMHEHESKMGATTKPLNNTGVLRCSHLPQPSENPAASVHARRRPPLPPPLPLPNPSWISMRNFRDVAVWEMPELHRYQTWWILSVLICVDHLLTFDWRMSSQLNTFASAKRMSPICPTLIFRCRFLEVTSGFLTN